MNNCLTLGMKVRVFEKDMLTCALKYKIKSIRLHPNFYVEMLSEPEAKLAIMSSFKWNEKPKFMGIELIIDNEISEGIRFEI